MFHYCHWKTALESHLFLGELISNHLYLVVLMPRCSSQPDIELLDILIENFVIFSQPFSLHFDRKTQHTSPIEEKFTVSFCKTAQVLTYLS